MQNTTPCSLSPVTPPTQVLTLQYLHSIRSASQFAPDLNPENRGTRSQRLLNPESAPRKALSRQELEDILSSALAICEDCPDIPDQDPHAASD